MDPAAAVAEARLELSYLCASDGRRRGKTDHTAARHASTCPAVTQTMEPSPVYVRDIG